MKQLSQLWNVVNGKKTLVFSFVSAVYFFAIAHNFVAYNQTVVDALQLLVGASAAHKAVKYVQK